VAVAVVVWFAAAVMAQMPAKALRDCPDCPVMVVIPAGEFLMGTPESEPGRDADEGPRRQVTFKYSFAVSKFEVTRGQYAAFAQETKRAVQGNCWYRRAADGVSTNDDPKRSFLDPGFSQDENHPVVCVSWDDAKAYADWLSMKTRQAYRLLSEAEWEYAARAGTITSRPWGDDPNDACRNANIWDRSAAKLVRAAAGRGGEPAECDDGGAYTVPVGRYAPNRHGLHDMIGNAWEWVEDCWSDSYWQAPSDGGARVSGDCTSRVIRGGGWETNARSARAGVRNRDGSFERNNNLGFRVARTLP
jgi:formylglycine-generating enzyme required for sulfatase activity